MKLAPNKEKVLSIRMSTEDFKYLSVIAYMAGMTVSKYTRTLVTASVNAAKIQEQKGVLNLADFETVLNDKL